MYCVHVPCHLTCVCAHVIVLSPSVLQIQYSTHTLNNCRTIMPSQIIIFIPVDFSEQVSWWLHCCFLSNPFYASFYSQWKGEVPVGLDGWTDREREHLGEELSDVLIYLVRLAEQCRVDLPTAVQRKIGLNCDKYPKNVVFGSSKKYTEYSSTDKS